VNLDAYNTGIACALVAVLLVVVLWAAARRPPAPARPAPPPWVSVEPPRTARFCQPPTMDGRYLISAGFVDGVRAGMRYSRFADPPLEIKGRDGSLLGHLPMRQYSLVVREVSPRFSLCDLTGSWTQVNTAGDELTLDVPPWGDADRLFSEAED